MQHAPQTESDDISFGIEIPVREKASSLVKPGLSTAGNLLAIGAGLTETGGFLGLTLYGAASGLTPALSTFLFSSICALSMKVIASTASLFMTKGSVARECAGAVSTLGTATYGLLSLTGLEMNGGAQTPPEQLVQRFAAACVVGGLTTLALRSGPLHNLFAASAKPGSNEASAAPRPATP